MIAASGTNGTTLSGSNTNSLSPKKSHSPKKNKKKSKKHANAKLPRPPARGSISKKIDRYTSRDLQTLLEESEDSNIDIEKIDFKTNLNSVESISKSIKSKTKTTSQKRKKKSAKNQRVRKSNTASVNTVESINSDDSEIILNQTEMKELVDVKEFLIASMTGQKFFKHQRGTLQEIVTVSISADGNYLLINYKDRDDNEKIKIDTNMKFINGIPKIFEHEYHAMLQEQCFTIQQKGDNLHLVCIIYLLQSVACDLEISIISTTERPQFRHEHYLLFNFHMYL